MLKICQTCGVHRKVVTAPDDPTELECRANPPTIHASGVGEWPRVCKSDWCGAWRDER